MKYSAVSGWARREFSPKARYYLLKVSVLSACQLPVPELSVREDKRG
jgi:hypothetical protein